MHLIYLDEERTHELHAEINRLDAGMSLVTTEFPVGSADPLEAIQAEQVLRTPQEVLARLTDLEARLASTGTYWRADAAQMAWAKVAPSSLPPLDLRAHELDLPDGGGRIRFHHFHGGRRDQLFVSMPRKDVASRHILANLEFEFPHVDDADLNIVHPRLAPRLLDSTIAREHIELPRHGFRKLVEPSHYHEAYGAGWQEAAKSTFQKATQLLLGRRPDGVLAKDAPREDASVTSELEAALASRGVAEARAHFLAPSEAERLVRGGEFAIRRFVTARRRRADHRDQWRLSILEAALLIEWGQQAGRQDVIDLEAGKLVRYARTMS